MEMKDVKSSQIAAIGHDASSDTLAVRFNNGGTYHYHDVPRDKFEAFMNANSKGSHLAQHIKGQHRFTKIAPAPRGPRHS